MSKIIYTSGSDHITNDLFADGPETCTVAEVVDVVMEGEKKRHALRLEEIEGKTWVPALTVLKALAQVWTLEKNNWVGQKLTLYQDPSIKIGKETVGGVRVSAVTGITEPQSITVRGAMNRPVTYKFQPIQSASPQPDPIEKALTDSWGDPERMRKAVAHLAEIDHPRHQAAADRLAELEVAES